MPAPTMRMSVLGGREGVLRWVASGWGGVIQKEVVVLEMGEGKVDEEGRKGGGAYAASAEGGRGWAMVSWMCG